MVTLPIDVAVPFLPDPVELTRLWPLVLGVSGALLVEERLAWLYNFTRAKVLCLRLRAFVFADAIVILASAYFLYAQGASVEVLSTGLAAQATVLFVALIAPRLSWAGAILVGSLTFLRLGSTGSMVSSLLPVWLCLSALICSVALFVWYGPFADDLEI
jgi:hypothetical protein